MFTVAGQKFRAHRYSYAMLHGMPPSTIDVCHTCDTPQCVNPEHLFVGTRTDNMRDCRSKGRLASQPRRTHCKRGHRLDEANTYCHVRRGVTERSCKICRDAAHWDYRRRLGKRELAPRPAAAIDANALTFEELEVLGLEPEMALDLAVSSGSDRGDGLQGQDQGR